MSVWFNSGPSDVYNNYRIRQPFLFLFIISMNILYEDNLQIFFCIKNVTEL